MSSEVPVFVVVAVKKLQSLDLGGGECFADDVQYDKDIFVLIRKTIQSGTMDLGNADAGVVSTLMKEFFAALPQPVVEMTDEWKTWTEIDNQEYRLSTMRSLVYGLAVCNRKLLYYLVSFFRTMLPPTPVQYSVIPDYKPNPITVAFGPRVFRGICVLTQVGLL